MSEVSDLTFDTADNRIIGFDGADDQFFEFQTDGTAQILSVASRPLNSMSTWRTTVRPLSCSTRTTSMEP